ncbi:hypothetical protein BKA67DRAFT_581503 [Truncatella angustata]|uniref:Uncharacterized protein n=1 Tax=Truncatella angustata TaxID=152316 RepID=A0A9P8RPS0_9PEZI|nr:uncharacterized protein BKA67DRAFT_581503 [Truncatella angustata]KAH6647051.1 hypothetical protein BKA67DRAFT_581503 [Truncatella angustata]
MASFLVAFSAAFGAAEAIRATQSRARKDEHRGRKNNLVIHCPKSSDHSQILEGRNVVLSGDKLYVDTGTDPDLEFGHPFAGYFLAFPDTEHSGLVSTICDEPPIMNWIYVDCDTHELKFGTRPYAESNYTGPFDCTRQDRRLTLGSWEGFFAVREDSGFWALYFDVDQDRLGSKLSKETPILEVQLLRVELQVQHPHEETSEKHDTQEATEVKVEI